MTEPDDVYGRFALIIERIGYRDWRWLLGVDDGRHYLQVEFDALDSFTGEPATQRGRKWLLSPYMTDSEVVSTALMAVLTAVEHEAREDFRYRGEAIFGPHFNVDRLYLLAAEKALDVRP